MRTCNKAKILRSSKNSTFLNIIFFLLTVVGYAQTTDFLHSLITFLLYSQHTGSLQQTRVVHDGVESRAAVALGVCHDCFGGELFLADRVGPRSCGPRFFFLEKRCKLD